MAGIYYNNLGVGDILLIKLKNKEVTNSMVKNDLVTLYYSDEIIGYNILNVSKYFNISEKGLLIKEKLIVIKKVNQIFNLDILEEQGSNIKVGKIIEVVKHPKSSHLSILKVDFKNEIATIVTGVQNIELNSNAVFALPNAFLPNGNQIISDTVMNVLSDGMAVSYKTLGIKDDTNLILLSDDSVGKDFLLEVPYERN